MTMVQPDTSTKSDSVLLAMIKEQRIRGRDYLQIEQMYGIPAPKSEQLMKDYYANKIASIDPNEQRMLQLDRLEGMIDVLWSQMSMGNTKASETLGKHLEQISSLLGLSLETQRTEIRIITDDQSRIIYQMVDGVSGGLLALVQKVVKDEKVLALIEDEWDGTVLDTYSAKRHEVIEEAVIVA